MEHTNDPLKAPNETDLSDVEHLQDRSNLTHLYPNAKKQWSGELISAEERSTLRDTHTKEIGRSIRRRFFSIGFLAPLPIFLTAMFAVTIREVIPDIESLKFMLLPLIVLGIILLWLIFALFKKVNDIFYDHAMRVVPFYVTLISFLSMSAAVTYLYTRSIHENSPFLATAITGGVTLVWSIIFSLLILFIWTTPALSSRGKTITLFVVAGLLVAATASAIYLAL